MENFIVSSRCQRRNSIRHLNLMEFPVWCVANSLGVPQAFLRQFSANATKHSDYVRKHLWENAQKGLGNGRNLRHTTLAADGEL